MTQTMPMHDACVLAGCQYAEEKGVGQFYHCSPRCLWLDKREPERERIVGTTHVYHERPDRQHPEGPRLDLAIAQVQVDKGGAYLAQFRGLKLACMCTPTHCGGLALAYLAEGLPLDCLDLFLRNC
jgi:hypothetical protein